MFNGKNLLDLNYTIIKADSYEEALNDLNHFIVGSFKRTGELIQPTIPIIDNVISEFSIEKITSKPKLIAKPRPLTYMELVSVLVGLDNSGNEGRSIIKDSFIDCNRILDTVSSIIYASPDRENYLVNTNGKSADQNKWTYKYKQGAKFKVVEISDRLMNIPKSKTRETWHNPILLVDYDSVEGREFIIGKQKYNDMYLTKSQFAHHRGFNALIPDEKLKVEFGKMMWQLQKNPKKAYIGFDLDECNKDHYIHNSYERQLRLELSISFGITRTLANFSFENHYQSGHFSFLAITPKE